MNSRRLVCRESSILSGDGGSVMTVSPSRPEARRRFGSETANELGAPVASSIPEQLPGREPASTRKGYEDGNVGQYTEQYTAILHDLVRLALVTGARLNELCALETRDAHHREDGWWITIREGKTQVAVREVPIHESAAHVIERRRKSKDGFLLEGLVPGGTG
jgi:Phage integrase family